VTDHPNGETQITQKQKFEELARELECDEDEAAFDEALKRIARAPKPEPQSDDR
jgi:hypothetical protein